MGRDRRARDRAQVEEEDVARAVRADVVPAPVAVEDADVADAAPAKAEGKAAAGDAGGHSILKQAKRRSWTMFNLTNRTAFVLMTALFRIRDAIWPPETTLRELGIAPKQAVIDFGCGPGGYAFTAARLVGPLGKVYAVDSNPLAVKSIQKGVQQRGLENIVSLMGDSPEQLPARCADLALMFDVLHELRGSTPILNGIERTLKPTGVLAVSDHHMRREEILAMVMSNGVFEFDRHFKGVFCFTRRIWEPLS